MKISEHKFDRLELDEIFAHKPISQFINDDMKTNLGTGSQNLKKIGKSYCPIFSFWSWNFQGRNVTVLTEFLTESGWIYLSSPFKKNLEDRVI